MNKKTVSEQLYQKLLEIIKSDLVKVGDKLPSENALCAEYGVGRSTVREVIRMLQAKGFVDIKRGSGIYVLSKTEYAPENISQWILDNKESIINYMNVRIAIEELAVKLFIQQFDRKCLKNMQKIEEQFEDAILAGDVDKMVTLDEAFHSAIAKGTKNELLISICKQLEETFRKYRYVTFMEANHRNEAVAGHRNILASISNRDTNSALFNMRNHLEVSIDNAIKQAYL